MPCRTRRPALRHREPPDVRGRRSDGRARRARRCRGRDRRGLPRPVRGGLPDPVDAARGRLRRRRRRLDGRRQHLGLQLPPDRGHEPVVRARVRRALDLNPVENPWVKDEAVEPPAGAEFASRPAVAGVIQPDDATVRAFRAAGWYWGGYWSGPVDYQHFSTSGR
ncbi:M15 family metallopeptidase [Oerskovia sp. M15]